MKGIKNILTKERLDTVVNGSKKFLDFAVPIVGVLLFSNAAASKLETMRYNVGKAGYDDAVRAIMNSGMWSTDKSKAVTLLKEDKSSEFYKAVIDIVRSSMWSEDKLKTIQSMCKNDQDVSEDES